MTHKHVASEAGLGEAGAGYPVFAEGQRYFSQVLAPGLAGEGRVDEVGDLERTLWRPIRRVTPGRPRS
jgi:hypothetical protein